MNWLESQAIASDSLLSKMQSSSTVIPSSASPVEPGVNQRGPPRKAKYSLVTDSVTVARAKGEKNPCEGSETEPETMHLQAVGALCTDSSESGQGDCVPFA